ncbi:hypothetical protein [Streptomyces formicae]|uniref:Lipoprotein n=1 Tax=Streptomyces formicae TaxID=1616117 RepID=A0ABY3WEC0_9ACTN|nr:hypothetical protein [Streptomyces formicae]UNM10921.1 hypothetical protein J4032_04780 [Streptomyces formicae]
MRRRVRRAGVALAGVALAAAVATGCGIRTTSVPVDAGEAPSRMPCSVGGKETAAQAQPEALPVRVYLLCASALVAVDRTVPLPEKAAGDRGLIAAALLNELLADPSAAEREAGFVTNLRGPLTVRPARENDPRGTLRLSRQPEDLPPAALAQLVCTFAEGEAAADGGTVVLGGPGDYPPRGYRCTDAAKERPETVLPTVGPLPGSGGS